LIFLHVVSLEASFGPCGKFTAYLVRAEARVLDPFCAVPLPAATDAAVLIPISARCDHMKRVMTIGQTRRLCNARHANANRDRSARI